MKTIATVCVLIACGGAANADVIISNLDGNDGSQTADINALRCKGMGFYMPAGDDYILDSAVLRLETFGSDIRPIIEIWSDAGGNASAPLTRLNNPSFAASGIANYEFTADAGFVLSADTHYWVVAYGEDGADRVDWKASSPSVIPTGYAVHDRATFGTSGPPPVNTSSIVVSYALNAHVVPAPAGMALLGFAGLAATRRRR